MKKSIKHETKKARLLRLLAECRGRVPLAEAARQLYGRDGELEQLRVIRAMNAYRAVKDADFAHIRVREKHIVDLRPGV